MKLHIVSDVHGAHSALRSAADGSDAFICLGDLILFLDYDDPTQGIYAELFGAEHTSRYIELRTANQFDAARSLSQEAWKRIGVTSDEERAVLMRRMVRNQYEVMFADMPESAYLTYGNVDVPELWPDYLRPGHRVIDKAVIEVEGMRWGFIGGGLVSPMRTPYELTPEDYAAAVSYLGPVDILFTHIPPALPELRYDTIARRFEVGSEALRSYIDEYQPAYHFFGHVHQPLAQRMRRGFTECINVGHFHSRRTPFKLTV